MFHSGEIREAWLDLEKLPPGVKLTNPWTKEGSLKRGGGWKLTPKFFKLTGGNWLKKNLKSERTFPQRPSFHSSS